jgi:hypothetical protein
VTAPASRPISPAGRPRSTPRPRSWWAIRWRQFKNAPRPIVRAVTSSLVVAVALGILYLAYDVAISRGAVLPGGDLRFAAVALDVLLVVLFGSVVTWLIVPLPRGSGTTTTRTPWSAALGFLAAIPVAYLVLVVESQVLKPLLT